MTQYIPRLLNVKLLRWMVAADPIIPRRGSATHFTTTTLSERSLPRRGLKTSHDSELDEWVVLECDRQG